MTGRNRARRKISRRQVLVSVAGVAGVGAVLQSAAANTPLLDMLWDIKVDLRSSRTRVVAAHLSGTPGKSVFTPARVMGGVLSQLGSVDLFAFHGLADSATAECIAEVTEKARTQRCYVAVSANGPLSSIRDEVVLIGPRGLVLAQTETHGVKVYTTEVGVIAQSTKFWGSSDRVAALKAGADIIIHSGADQVSGHGAYLIHLSSRTHEDRPEAVVCTPGGAVMTEASAGWNQGVVASLDISALRHDRARLRFRGA